ncbi:MAG: RHS repeat-associated core domain-containing protein, partial [Planctomycetota bacterium]
YSYDSAGRRIKAVLADGEITYTYDNANQLTEEQRIGSKASYSNSYTYDLAGNRVQKATASETTDYSYDSFNRLLRQTNSSYQGGNKVLISGEVDAADIGKVLVNGIPAVLNKGIFTAKVPLLPGENSVIAQAFDQAGNSSQATLRMNLDTTAEAAYTYDNNGNRIQKSYRGEQTVYNYDYDNQLSRIIYPNGASTQYTYDAGGRRIKEESFSEESLATKQYLYDGSTAIIERDGSGKTTAAYTRGVSIGGGIGGIISRTTQDAQRTAHYYLYDGQGNITHLTDTSGKVIINYDYDAFGSVVYQNGSLENNYQFQTKEYDSNSGLVYFGARYYDPSLGRWLTPDPLGMIDGPNLYLYCNNNPVGWVDPWGLCKEEDSYWEELEYWFNNALNTLDDWSMALTMNPMADGTPLPIDQGLGLIGLGVVKGSRGITTFWQYFTKGSTAKFLSKWFVKGKGLKPPYKLGEPARKALNLPPWNKATAVRPYYPEKVVGPRYPKPKPKWDWPKKGKGREYYDAEKFPD